MAQTLNTRIVLRNDSTTNWLANETQVLLKGEVGVEFLANGKVKMKVGDGTTAWKDLAYFGGEDAHVFEATLSENETKEDAIARVVGTTEKHTGDIAIVKQLINDDKYEYTAYVYNGSAWAAMDGNYNAENVYFDEDFTFTTKIGTVQTLTNGSATVAAAGKSVKDFFAGLFAQESQPAITAPSYSLSASPVLESNAEVGNYITGFRWDGNWSAGSYQYGSKEQSGSSTGITATYAMSENKESQSSSALDGTFTLANKIQIDSTSNKTYGVVTGVCTYTDSPYTPVTNIGNPASAGSLKGNTVNRTANVNTTGYRNTFYGTMTSKPAAMTSADIRALPAKSNKTLSNGSVINVDIPVGALRVVFAYPATLRDASSVLDVNGLNANITSGFTATTVEVEGANGFDPISYKVYYMDYANPNDKANNYKVTI